MNVEERKTSELRPYEGNPRQNDRAVEAVAASIREYGFRQPIVIDEAGVIIAGHTRWKAAQSLGLALHELAANAAKYGALSVPKGHVDINWRRLSPAEGAGVEIIWCESGGPTVTKPEQRGFGRLVIEQNLARSIDSDVDLTFPPDGLRCRVLIPPSQLTPV